MKLYSLLERLEDVDPESEVLFATTRYDDDTINPSYEISVYKIGDRITESGEDMSCKISGDGHALVPLVIIS